MDHPSDSTEVADGSQVNVPHVKGRALRGPAFIGEFIESQDDVM
jgi:hypothetical protein